MSETTTETTVTETDTTTTPPETGDGKDWQAEAAKWKALSRENEKQARANAEAAKRLDDIEAANATEQDKAVKAARNEGAQAERQRTNQILARAEARALAAEANYQDPSDAVAFLNLADVAVGDDGSVDPAEIKAQLADLAGRKPYLLKTKAEPTATQAGIGVTGNPVIDNSPRALISAGLAKTSTPRAQ